jgi:hypothetical protein
MSPRAARSWFVLAVLLLAVLASGCSGRPPDMARAAQPDWAVNVLGGPVQIALVVRTGALLQDPVWGPAIRRSLDKRKSSSESGSAGPDVVRGGDALAFSSTIELYGALLPGTPYAMGTSDDLRASDVRVIAVMRQVPPGLSPLAIAGKNGLATWRPARILPSGVAEHAPNPNANGYYLYVIPGGTWVLVDGATAPRANRVFSQTASAPPLPTFEPDALFAVYGGPGVISVARAKTPDERARLAAVEGVAFVMRPGQTGEFIVRVKYTDSASAKASEREVNDAIAKIGRNDALLTVILAALVSVDVDRDDDVLTLKATLHRALLDRLARE